MMRQNTTSELHTHRRLIADKVRICPAYSGRTHRLMAVHHYLMFRRLPEDTVVVVDHELSVMMLAIWYYVTHITGLHRIVSIFIHKVEGCLHMSLIIDHRA